jgi:hypothetical protein
MVFPWAAVISAGVSLFGASKARKQAAKQSREALAFQKEQQAILEKQKEEYRQIQFTNPYEDMENVYEDLTVNQQQAQFQAQQTAQQRANILESFRGAAGGSGIAGLAQAMANQGQLQAQEMSASIGAQETANRMAAAKGASAIDLAERQGDIMVQQAESSRQATLLGMQYGSTSGAQSAYQQALLNQEKANAAAQQMQMDAFTSLAGADWSGVGGGGNPNWTTSGVKGMDFDPTKQSPAGYWENGKFISFE